MGAMDFDETGCGESANAVFRAIVNEAASEKGYGGYSGSIAEKPGFDMLSLPKGVDIEDFVEEMSGKNDKWGNAYCLEVEKENRCMNCLDIAKCKNTEKSKHYRFFGCAPC